MTHFLFSFFSPGVSALCQVLAWATSTACCLWKHWRSGDPFYGGGCGGYGAILDKPGYTQSLS